METASFIADLDNCANKIEDLCDQLIVKFKSSFHELNRLQMKLLNSIKLEKISIDGNFFESILNGLNSLVKCTAESDSSRDYLLNIETLKLNFMKLILIATYEMDQKSVSEINLVSLMQQYQSLFIFSASRIYSRYDDYSLKQLVADQWFIYSLFMSKLILMKNAANLNFELLLNETYPEHVSLHHSFIRLAICAKDPKVIDDFQIEHPFNENDLLPYLKEFAFDYMANRDVSVEISHAILQVLLLIIEQIEFSDFEFINKIVEIIGLCIKSPACFEYLAEHIENSKIFVTFLRANISKFPIVDPILLKFLESYTSACLDYSDSQEKLSIIFNLDTIDYVLTVTHKNMDSVNLNRVSFEQVLVEKAFKSHGQVFNAMLSGRLLQMENEEMKVAFKLHDAILVLMSHVCFQLHTNNLNESDIIIVSIIANLLKMKMRIDTNFDFAPYFKTYAGLLVIIASKHSQLELINGAKTFLNHAFSLFCKKAPFSLLKKMHSSMCKISHNHITLTLFLTVLENLMNKNLNVLEQIFTSLNLLINEFDLAQSCDEILLKSFSQIFLSIACSNVPSSLRMKLKHYPYLFKFVLTYSICNSQKITELCMKFGTLPDVENNLITRLTIACQNVLIKFSEIDGAYVTRKYLNNENLVFNLSDLASQLSGPYSIDLKISAINITSLIIKNAQISELQFEKSNFVELNHKIIENSLLILKKYGNDAYSVSCVVDFLSVLISTNSHGNFVHKFLISTSDLTGDDLMNTIAMHINKFSYDILTSINYFVSEIVNQKLLQFFNIKILSKAIVQNFGEYLNSEEDFKSENLLSFLSIFKLFLDTKTKPYFADLMTMLHSETSLIRFVGKIFNCLSLAKNNNNDKLILALKDFFLNYNAINYPGQDIDDQEFQIYTLMIAKSSKVTVKCIQMLLENSNSSIESNQKSLSFAFMLLNIFLQKIIGDNIDYSQIFSDLVSIFTSLNDQNDSLYLSFDVLPLIAIILQADPSIINQKMTEILMLCQITIEFLNDTNIVILDESLKFTHCFNFLLIVMGNLTDRASSTLIHKYKIIDLVENYLTLSYSRALEYFDLISTLLAFLQTIFAHDSIVSDQVSVRIYKLIGLQLSDAMKNLNHQQRVILLSHALNLAKLASLNAVDVYENLASFFASHNVVIEDFLNESDVIINLDESEALQLLLKMLELMLNSNYKLCLREFKPFFIQIVQFITQINSALLKIQISMKTSISKIHDENYFVNIIKLSSSLLFFFNQRTLPVVDLIFKDMQFESDDLYYFNTTNINKSFQNWIDFSQSLSYAMNMLSGEENKIIYFPIVRQSLEILCSVAISQLYMLKKLNMFDDLAEDFYSNLKILLNLFSNKHFKSSPIQSPGIAMGSPALHMKLPAITIDQKVKQGFFGIVEYAFK